MTAKPRKTKGPKRVTYDQSVERDAQRETARETMYGLQELFDGHDTDRARTAKGKLDRVAVSNRAAREIGDPLNLTGHTKRRRGKAPRKTTDRKVSRDDVPHPRLDDRIETVDRVIDTIEAMYRRRQIGNAEKKAAETYRRAYDTVVGSIGGVMDPDKIRSGAAPGAPPPPAAFEAGERLAAAARILGAVDGRVVEMIVGEGRSVAETTASLFGFGATQREQDHTGHRLRVALQTLGCAWHGGQAPLEASRATSFFRAADARPLVGDAGTVERGRAAHVTRTAVYENS